MSCRRATWLNASATAGRRRHVTWEFSRRRVWCWCAARVAVRITAATGSDSSTWCALGSATSSPPAPRRRGSLRARDRPTPCEGRAPERNGGTDERNPEERRPQDLSRDPRGLEPRRGGGL